MKHFATAALALTAASTLCLSVAAPAHATMNPQPSAKQRAQVKASTARPPASPQADYSFNYDDRVIYQSFSVYQPYDKNMYATLNQQSDQLKQWGISDVWMPPAYRPFSMARYMEGYGMQDRYDLGEFPAGPGGERATKYGTSDELKSVVAKLHGQGQRVQMDLVPNQMIGMNQREMVMTNRVNPDGRSRFVDEFTDHHTTTWWNEPMLMYTKGGGKGQETYGLIKQFTKDHWNGTSTQNIGRGDLLRDANGKPYFVGAGANQNLPQWTVAGQKFDLSRGHNNVDGYLSARDAYEATPGNWRPYLINYPEFQQYAVANCGFADVNAVQTGDSQKMSIWQCKDNYIAITPAYGGKSEDRWYGNVPEGIEWKDQVQFVGHDTMGSLVNHEFLVGNDFDNSRADVLAEQENWIKFLLNDYGFDGFRIDAASHVHPNVLRSEARLTAEKFGGDRSKYTTYLESYNPEVMGPFEDGLENKQLLMDNWQRDAALNALSPGGFRTMGEAYGISAFTNRIVDANAPARPNWSFVSNHDKQTIQINAKMLADLGIRTGAQYGSPDKARSFADEYTKAGEKAALDAWWNDLFQVDKKLTDHNVPARYAMMLTNAKTVPTVWYGDLYRTDAAYMSVKTPYFDEIDALLKARKQYVDGPQKVHEFGPTLTASVRESGDRAKGIATVVSNNPSIDTWVRVPMGAAHANQAYRDVTGKNPGIVVTDGQGQLDLHVTGRADADVRGHLGVWAPVDTTVQTAVHGAIADKWHADRWVLGNPTTGENCGLRDGGCWQGFDNGAIYWSPATGAHWIKGEIYKKWASVGWEGGFLGYPITDEFCGLRDGGCGQHFQRGSIYWSMGTGAHIIQGAIKGKYAAVGWENSPLGYPVTDEICGLRDGGCFNHFQDGSIYWSPASEAHIIKGLIRDKWASFGWENSEFGYPVTDESCGLIGGGCFNHFQNHSIYFSPASGTWEVKGRIRDFWASTGWEAGRFGYPTGPEQCTWDGRTLDCHQNYQRGRINFSSARGIY